MKTVWTLLFLGLAEILAHIALKILFKKKNVKKGKRFLANLGYIAILGVTLYFALFPHNGKVSVTGTYEYASEDYWLTLDTADPFSKDGALRELQIRKWYPVDAKEGVDNLPVVVASHGSCGSIDNNISLYKELASHGYVVLAIAHPGHASVTRLSNGKKISVNMNFMKKMQKLKPQKNLEEAYETFNEWMDIRVTDIDAVISDYKNKYGKTEYIALGHSVGGSAAYGIARKRDDIVAVIALESPFMADIKGVKNGEYIFDESDYGIPMLNIYSDSSYDKLSEWKQYRENLHLLYSKNEHIVNIHYSGTRHMGLCDLSLETPVLSALMDGGFYEVEAEDLLTLINQDVMNFLKDEGF